MVRSYGLRKVPKVSVVRSYGLRAVIGFVVNTYIRGSKALLHYVTGPFTGP